MFAERLKKETQHAHVETEKLIIPKIKKSQTVEDYVGLLNIFYGFFKPLEDKIAFFVSSLLPDMAERRKALAIVDDKESLGIYSVVEESLNLPLIENTNHALGVMYVLEGSTLGGVHIAKMLKNNLAFTSEKGLSFFNGYGPETMEKWESFKQLLNTYPKNESDQEEIIESANNTFLKFKDWILKH